MDHESSADEALILSTVKASQAIGVGVTPVQMGTTEMRAYALR